MQFFVEKCCRAWQATVDNAIWLMRIACCMPKSTNAQLRMCNNFSFPLQQWLRERASIWGFTYVAYLLILFFYHCLDHPKRPPPVFPFKTLYAFLFLLSTCPPSHHASFDILSYISGVVQFVELVHKASFCFQIQVPWYSFSCLFIAAVNCGH